MKFYIAQFVLEIFHILILALEVGQLGEFGSVLNVKKYISSIENPILLDENMISRLRNGKIRLREKVE